MATEVMAVRSVKLPKKLLDEVIARAERERRTVSAMMRILIEEAMKNGLTTTVLPISGHATRAMRQRHNPVKKR